MPFRKLLAALNTLIAVAAAVLAGAVWWYAWRPLPQKSGKVRTDVSRTVRIARDSLGVPHIQAETLDDALFAQGYATAQERLWQMEGLRRLAAGELSEVVGPGALELDREARALRMRRLAEEAVPLMPPADRAALAAYARGVNAFIESHRDRLPLEFRLLGFEPRPWRVTDSALAGFQMIRTLTTTWKDEMLKRNLLKGGDGAKVDFLFPVRGGGEITPGSNAWAISGQWTASGKPILANDMHLEWAIPGTWFMAHLTAPGLNVKGVTLPGLPGVIVGHNDRIAWGITNLQFDVQDLYRERGEARTEPEIILVKGAKPVETVVLVTRHGPVISADGNERFAVRWVAAEASGFQYPFLEINRARNWAEFTAALRRVPGPGSNFVYADADGNIGYHAAGRLPIRKNYEGDLPVDGASGEFEWQGFIPFDELPSAFNPPGGVIVSANQNPFPQDYPYIVHGNFAPPYRSIQIHRLLTGQHGWGAGEMPAVQKDVYSAFSHFLAGELIAACDRRKVTNPALVEAVQLLRGWNGQMEKDLPQPMVVTLAFQHLRKAIAERASPGKGALYELQMAAAVIERLLRTRPPGWFADYDEAVVRSLADAVEEGQRMQGRSVKKWVYGKYHELTIAHPVGHRLPFVAKYFDAGPVPMSGSATTVKQTTRRLGPSMRFVADLGDWEKSMLSVPIGQSGHVLSKNYKDEWERYYSGGSFPMPFANPKAPDVLELVPR